MCDFSHISWQRLDNPWLTTGWRRSHLRAGQGGALGTRAAFWSLSQGLRQASRGPTAPPHGNEQIGKSLRMREIQGIVVHFRTLGPLEIIGEERPLSISGFNQKAILGYLLLKTGEVVSVRQLVAALWGENPPSTARKMVQNGISGLRRLLGTDGQHTVRLLTRDPGYVLHVPPESIDFTRFEHLARLGRSHLALGAAVEASRALREALALWRGPAMADLAEAGIEWPELKALQNARHAAYEDCVQAELSLGRHHELVGELEAASAAEPVRERLCGQLMLALYRCGRQSDALMAYQRTRSALVQEFGLDPGQELRDLEGRILRRDASLDVADGTPVPPVAVRTAPHLPERPGAPALPAEPPLQPGPRPAAVPPAPVYAEEERPVERTHASVVLVSLHPCTADDLSMDGADSEEIDALVKTVTLALEEEVQRFGGTVRMTLNTSWLLVFGIPHSREDDPERAVYAACAIRRRLLSLLDARPAPACFATVSPRVAVATDEVVATYRSYGDEWPATITGKALYTCARLLLVADSDRVRICDTTRQGVEDRFSCSGTARAADGWEVDGIAPRRAKPRSRLPFTGRQTDMGILRAVFDTVLRRQRPQVVTIVGDAGLGKTRLVEEFLRGVEESEAPVIRLVGRTPPYGNDVALSTLGGILRGYAGIDESTSRGYAERQLREAVERLVGCNDKSSWLLQRLRPCLDPERSHVEPGARREFGLAWRQLVEEIAADRPLIFVLDDLHWADETLLGVMAELSEHTGPVPVLLVATARPEVLQTRSCWRGGRHDAGTITLDRLSDASIRTLISAHTTADGTDRVPAARRSDDTDAVTGLVARIGGNPLFAGEFVGSRGATGDRAALPRRIRSIVTARLDMLSRYERAVLRDAAVLGDRLWAGAVAAVGGQDRGDVVNTLKRLEAKGLLQRVRPGSVDGEEEYVFTQAVVQEVAYDQLTRRARAEKHWRATDWLTALPADRAGLLPRHFEQAVALGRETERSEHTARCLGLRAQHALAQAGQRALAVGAYEAAAQCLRSAIGLCPPLHPERQHLLALYRQSLAPQKARPRHRTPRPTPDTGLPSEESHPVNA
ncbi:BTAD domain-containing putative transcriptional regulator [Streptomyces sp. NPDC046881]|uniref:BTAD domain-containing putative transcriptional regulator n=1 Tax=Streptomyces sp. NPDC046881 TaxID=3155374 RepID=UPI00340EBDD6